MRIGLGRLDLTERVVVRGEGGTVGLTTLETRLLTRLARDAPEVVPRRTLLADVWGVGDKVRTQVLEQTVRRVRRKLEADPSRPRHLLTEHGVGYRLVPLPEGARPGLPRHPHGFLGRASELEALDQWQGDPSDPVCTVVGPGGFGKSALAVAWARTLKRPPWFVSLGSCDAARLEDRIAGVLGVPAERLVHWWDAGEPCVVVLDEVEAIAEALRARLEAWLADTGRVQFLVTSRVRLGVAGERVIPLGPLPAADAGRLFERHRRAAGLPPVDDPGEIVRSVDGVPLAIRLLAGQPHPELAHHAAVGPLDACLERSWARLDEEQRHVLVAACTFRGGMWATTLAEVAGAEPQAVHRVVGTLVDTSMLQVAESASGLRLFAYEVVRGFVRRRAPASQWEACERRRLSAFAAFGRREVRCTFATQPDTLERLAIDEDNVRTVLRWGLDHGDIVSVAWVTLAFGTLVARTRPRLGASLAATVRRRPGVPAEMRHELGLFEGAMTVLMGRPTEALPLLRELLDDRAVRGSIRGRLLIELGNAYWTCDAFREARAHYTEACEVLEQAGDRWFLANAVDNEAAAAARLGDFDASLVGHLRALRLHHETGNAAAAAATESNLAAAAHRAGDPERAEHLYTSAVSTSIRFGYANTRVEAQVGLAGVLLHQGALERAAVAAAEAQAVAAQLGNPTFLALALAMQAEIATRRGPDHWAEAAAQLQGAQTAADVAGRPFLDARVRGLRGELAYQRGQARVAERHLARSASTFEAHGHVLAVTMITCRRGLVALSTGAPDQARGWLAQAEALDAARGPMSHPAVLFELERLRAALAAGSVRGGHDGG